MRLEPVTPELLAEVVRRIVLAAQPERVILFGSYANGSPREHSDLDLFVVKSGTYDALQIQGELDSLFWDLSLPIDFLVRTPTEVSREVDLGNRFVRDEVLRKGKVLYERSPGRA